MLKVQNVYRPIRKLNMKNKVRIIFIDEFLLKETCFEDLLAKK